MAVPTTAPALSTTSPVNVPLPISISVAVITSPSGSLSLPNRFDIKFAMPLNKLNLSLVAIGGVLFNCSGPGPSVFRTSMLTVAVSVLPFSSVMV